MDMAKLCIYAKLHKTKYVIDIYLTIPILLYFTAIINAIMFNAKAFDAAVNICTALQI